ncbi:MAG: flagellar motor switch protein FliN [Exilispira sp.]
MGDGALSQSEIDALLQGTDSFLDSGDISDGSAALSSQDISTLKDIFSSVIDAQSSTLKISTNSDIQITNPKIDIISKEGLATLLPFPVLQVTLPFEDELPGFNSYLFKSSDALLIGSKMMGQESKELTEMISSAVSEATSQIIGSSITYFSNTFKIHINTGSPQHLLANSFSDLILPSDDFLVFITYNLKIDKTSSTLYHIISLSIAQVLASLKGGTKTSARQPERAEISKGFEMPSESKTKVTRSYQPAAFSKLEPVLSEEENKNISLLLDVEMEVTVELGKTQKTIKEILSMGEGTIITLNRLAGETLDVLVNGKPIAKGEAIVIEEYFGVRITEILSKEARISSLK